MLAFFPIFMLTETCKSLLDAVKLIGIGEALFAGTESPNVIVYVPRGNDGSVSSTCCLSTIDSVVTAVAVGTVFSFVFAAVEVVKSIVLSETTSTTCPASFAVKSVGSTDVMLQPPLHLPSVPAPRPSSQHRLFFSHSAWCLLLCRTSLESPRIPCVNPRTFVFPAIHFLRRAQFCAIKKCPPSSPTEIGSQWRSMETVIVCGQTCDNG